MNLLAVDIGNTDIKFGIFRNGVLDRFWRATGTRTNPEKFSALMRDSLARAGANFDGLVYTSVVPDVEYVFHKTLHYCFNLPQNRILAIDPDRIRLPLDVSRYPTDQLGMDRLVNACSARLLYPNVNLVVIDCGTATTFDLVDAENAYLGGAIAPGLQTFLEGLPGKTARLPLVSMEKKRPQDIHMGTDTLSCMEAGLGIGYRGLMKELLKSAVTELGTDEFMIIGTGGLAETVVRLCGLEKYFHVIDPMLTLRGLELLYQFNQKARKA